MAEVEAFFPIRARYAIGNVRPLGTTGLILCLLAGIILRTIWPEVMEYKADEESLFTKCINVGRTEPLPANHRNHRHAARLRPAAAVAAHVGRSRSRHGRETTDRSRVGHSMAQHRRVVAARHIRVALDSAR